MEAYDKNIGSVTEDAAEFNPPAIARLINVNKDYYQDKLTIPVLRDICLDVYEGDFLSVMGPSGSGKTTLMNIMGCLDIPTSGSYLLNGTDVSTLDDAKTARLRNKCIGFVFQTFNLLPKSTAWQNVALPLIYAGVPQKERKERAIAALTRVGLAERVDFRPNQLSGGQCQRVAIARAMVANPRILLADEPTGALDTKSGEQVMDLFEELNREGTTIVIITHAPEVARRTDRIMRIRDGMLTYGE